MPGNFPTGTVTSTGSVFASDQISSVDYPRIKVSIGGTGSATDLNFGQTVSSASVPVVVASDNTLTVLNAAGSSTIGTVTTIGTITVISAAGSATIGTVTAIGTVTVVNAAGSAIIGTVAATGTVTNVNAAGSNTIGTVSIGTVSGTVTTRVLAGTISTVSTVAGTVTARLLTGTLSTLSTVAGTVTTRLLAGTVSTVSAVGTVAGTVTTRMLAGTVSTVSTVAGTVTARLLAGTISTVSTVAGTLSAQLVAGTASAANVGLVGRTSGGLSVFYENSLGTSFASVSTTNANLYGIHAFNATAAPLYLQAFNTTSSALGLGSSTPFMQWVIPGNADSDGAGFIAMVPQGVAFSSAMTVAVSSDSEGSAAVGATHANVIILYQ